MTGLEKILEEIKAEAKANADATLAEADKKANEIISEAEVEANKKADFIAQNTDKKVQDILERGNSSANLEKQKARLVAKQQVISTVLANSSLFPVLFFIEGSISFSKVSLFIASILSSILLRLYK